MFKKLFAIIAGLFRKGGEAIIDKNAQTLIDQQIHQAEEAVKRGKSSLVDLMTDQGIHEKKAKDITAKLAEYEASIVALQEKGTDEANKTALEVAAKYAELEASLNTLNGTIAGGAQAIAAITRDIKKAETEITDRKRLQSESAAKGARIKIQQEVSAASADRNSDLRLAAEAQDRLTQQQDRELARFAAAEEYQAESSGENLDKKLIELGVKSGAPTAQSVLDRFAKKPAPAATE